jgi:hypothetical protein
MVSIIEFNKLKQRVSALEDRFAPQSLKVPQPITLLLDAVGDDIKSVNPSLLLHYLQQADIFVQIYIRNAIEAEVGVSMLETNTYFQYSIVNPSYTVFALSRTYRPYDDKAIYFENDKTTGFYFFTDNNALLSHLDGVYCVINSPQQQLLPAAAAELIHKGVGGRAIDLYKSKHNASHIAVNILGDNTTTTSTSSSEENFGVGSSKPQLPVAFDGGGE